MKTIETLLKEGLQREGFRQQVNENYDNDASVEKVALYIYDNVVENFDEMYTVADLACETIYDEFNFKPATPEIIMAIFIATFDNVISKLEELEKAYSEYMFTFSNRFVIGYSNRISEEDEKMGNFQFFIKNAKNKSKDIDYVSDAAAERVTQWTETNVVQNSKTMLDIAGKTLADIRKIDIQLPSSDFIIPIFVSVYNAITQVASIRRREVNDSSYSFIVAARFTITARQSEDTMRDSIMFTPTPSSKLSIKSDADASAKFD